MLNSSSGVDFPAMLKKIDPPENLILWGVTFITFFDKMHPYSTFGKTGSQQVLFMLF